MTSKLRIAEMKSINKIDCLIIVFMRYSLKRTTKPQTIASPKKIFNPIHPKAILAYSVKILNTGEDCANANEKK